jgi:transaldolase
MKIFIDSADVDAIRKAAQTGLVDGVTTNPSHVAKSGKKFHDVVKEIAAIVPGPISAEVMAEDAQGMVKEAVDISSIASNVIVKIPMTVEGIKAVPVLERQKKIRCNVTMCFSPTQAYLAMKAGASYLSIVLSRLDAIGNESDILVNDTAVIKENYGFPTSIIAGSLKTQNHLLACLRAGIDVATMPPDLFWTMFRHALTDDALETFKKDWEKVPK